MFLLFLALAAATLAGAPTAAAQPNPIQIENEKPGSTDWLLTAVARHDDEVYEQGWRRRKGIEAYASRTSVRAGDMGEQELMGATSYGVGFADWTSDKTDHWAFEGTGMKPADRVAQLVGWEYHGPPLGNHENLVVLSQGLVYGANGEKRTGTYATTIYTAPKGNLVFNAGTCWWNVVLSHPPGFQSPPRKDFRRDDARIQRITKNILDRMIETRIGD